MYDPFYPAKSIEEENACKSKMNFYRSVDQRKIRFAISITTLFDNHF